MKKKKDIIINSSLLEKDLVSLLKYWNHLYNDCKKNRNLHSKNSIEFAQEDAALNSLEWCMLDIKKLIKGTNRELYRRIMKRVSKKKKKLKGDNMKLQIIVDELWKHKDNLYRKQKLNGFTDITFEYPNYSNISKKISNKLSSDQVDAIQQALYDLDGIIKNKTMLKRYIADCSNFNTWS